MVTAESDVLSAKHEVAEFGSARGVSGLVQQQRPVLLTISPLHPFRAMPLVRFFVANLTVLRLKDLPKPTCR